MRAPSSTPARKARIAISPRLATRIFENISAISLNSWRRHLIVAALGRSYRAVGSGEEEDGLIALRGASKAKRVPHIRKTNQKQPGFPKCCLWRDWNKDT
ncbi:hypothetical protein GCM10009673_03320 [Nesterenkonia sandarakina]